MLMSQRDALNQREPGTWAYPVLGCYPSAYSKIGARSLSSYTPHDSSHPHQRGFSSTYSVPESETISTEWC
ncbi:hypothetical protein BDV96DRAFT_564562 [Lophiotrema nucula]|uniref:Uncharacterized protein n=1 Tax=Lophiotrema nucula TaxID=690887 RepID=A0A6A5ZPG3_9PLEO|nr:hypothetical protein BDV96DRAFT_564562 [Lophiotrema nucula]